VKVYSSPVDWDLLKKFQKLLKLERAYITGTDAWYSYSKLKINLPVFRNFPVKIISAKISRVKVNDYVPVTGDYGWHRDSDVPKKSIRLLIPLTDSGEYHMQMENSKSWKLEMGRVYSIPATELHRLIIKKPSSEDFYCLVLDVKENHGKTVRK
jgi:hypothetical protein